ncbi:MAG TPA: hydrolase [Anaeromyxobacteraceae bacterium]|jgi:nicotinamidase-related amidase
MRQLPRLDRKGAQVLVVDLQERLVPAMWDVEPVVKQARTMILAARDLGLPVICTEQYPKGLGPTIPSIREVLPSPPLAKMHFACGSDEAVRRALGETGRRQVIVVGVETHVCVYQSCRDLLAEGYEVHLCADAVTSRREEHRRVALEALRDGGVLLTSVETSIFDLLHVAGTPEFKKVSAYMK